MSKPNNGTIHVGDKPHDFQDWERIQLCFHDFEDLLTDTESKGRFSCLDHTWNLTLHPGGGLPTCKKGMVSVDLVHESEEGISFKYGIAVKDGNDNKVVDIVRSTAMDHFNHESHTRCYLRFE
jgi:hypothetical protein